MVELMRSACPQNPNPAAEALAAATRLRRAVDALLLADVAPLPFADFPRSAKEAA